MKNHFSKSMQVLNTRIYRLAGIVFVAMFCVALSACRGAPCSNCGGYGQQGYGAANPYQQPYAQGTQYPGVVAPQGVYQQGNTQPGFYNPGSVPIAPQQGQPGSAYGGQ